MGKKKETKEEEPKKLEEVKQASSENKGSREKKWKEFLARYQASNPVKYDSKKANKEFDKIPDSFNR